MNNINWEGCPDAALLLGGSLFPTSFGKEVTEKSVRVVVATRLSARVFFLHFFRKGLQPYRTDFATSSEFSLSLTLLGK